MNTDLDSQPDIKDVTGNGCRMVGGNPSKIKINSVKKRTKQKKKTEEAVLKIFPKNKQDTQGKEEIDDKPVVTEECRRIDLLTNVLKSNIFRERLIYQCDDGKNAGPEKPGAESGMQPPFKINPGVHIRELGSQEESAYHKETYCSEFQELEQINIQGIVNKRELKNLGMHGHNRNHTQETDIRNLMIIRTPCFFCWGYSTHSLAFLKLKKGGL